MFFENKNFLIFEKIQYLLEQGITANFETLGQELINNKNLLIYMTELETNTPATLNNCNYYISKIIEAYKKRKVLLLNQKISDLINEKKIDFNNLKKILNQELTILDSEKITIDEKIDSLLNRKPDTKEIENEFLYNLTTPTLKFSNLFKNLIIYENELVSITGESGIGKTSIALQIIKELLYSGNNKYRFLILSKELNTYVTTCKLAGIFPYSKTPINGIDEEIYKDDFIKYQNIRTNDKISIISRKDLENNNIKDDIEVIKESIRNFKKQKKKRNDFYSFDNFNNALAERKNEEHLIILIDYFNILETKDKFFSEYEKEAYLIEELKNIRDTNQDVTIFVINTVNKTAMNANKHQGSIKGNTEIIYGLNLALTITKIKGKELKDALTDEKKAKEHIKYIINCYSFENELQNIEEYTFIRLSSLKQRFIDNADILMKTKNFNKFYPLKHKNELS
jgi:replicative DNA helicase